MPKPLNPTEKAYHDLVRRMPCGVCGEPGPSYAHHVREDQGFAMRAGHFCVVPLCYACHQGPNGIHGDGALWRVYGVTELDVLDETIGHAFVMRLMPI